MKIMLIEDVKEKHERIASYLIEQGVLENDIIHVWNMSDFSSKLGEDISLFIIDFYLPNYEGADPTQNGRAILQSIKKTPGKHDALLLAISSYPADFLELRQEYEAQGCILADYSKESAWQSTLDQQLVQRNKNVRFDFIIFCALREERNPYVTLFEDGRQSIRAGVDCYDINIDAAKGTIVLLPDMGLVNAAIIAATCINRYSPTVVGMSGVCGGFSGRAEIGQLFASKMAYEYQSGKWTPDGFLQAPYQVNTELSVQTEIDSLINQDGLLDELETGFTGNMPNVKVQPKSGVFTSGSAVIADEGYGADIQAIHRKVNALDMEIYSVKQAAQLSSCKPKCVCAKTVVDLCDDNKGDQVHEYGAYISAKFLIKAMQKLFD